MPEQLISLIEKKIDLFFRPAMTDMNFEVSSLITPLKPDDLRRIGSSIKQFSSIIGKAINHHSSEILKIIKEVIAETGLDQTQKNHEKIFQICEARIHLDSYIHRLDRFLEGIDRHYSSMGIKFDQSKYDFDFSNVKYEAMVKTLVRRNLEKIETDLNILAHTSGTCHFESDSDLSFEDVKKAIDLKPNYYGIGIHLNSIIPKIKNWRKK